MSSPKLKLVSFAICPFVQRAAILLELKGLEYEIEYIDLANKPDWFLKISPLGKVPLLIVDDIVLFESQVIADYLDELTGGGLYPEDPLQKALHRALIEFGSAMLTSQWLFMAAKDQQGFETYYDKLKVQLDRLENEVSSGPYFQGNEISMLDISFAPLLQRLSIVTEKFSLDIFDNTPKIKKLASELQKEPAIKNSVVDDFEDRLFKVLEQQESYLFLSKA